MLDAITGNENEVVAGADTGYGEESTTSVGTEFSVTGVDDTEKLRCGVWIWFGVSGGDDIITSFS